VFSAQADMDFVISQYRHGFVESLTRFICSVRTGYRGLYYMDLGWKDEEGAVLLEALEYAVEHCQFPHGDVMVKLRGNPLSDGMVNRLAALQHVTVVAK
jgi:hypothetical protein